MADSERASRRYRLLLNRASLGLTTVLAAISVCYLASWIGDVNLASHLTSSASLAWHYESEGAAAFLQGEAWARWTILLGMLSILSLSPGRFRGLTLAEKVGLVSKDWKRMLSRWSLLLSSSFLLLFALLNYYANASSWAIRWDFYEAIQALGLVQLGAMVYQPVGVFSGIGEIAKWFALSLSMTVASFFIVRMRLGPTRAIIDSTLVLFVCLFLYELGLGMFCSGYEYVWVTALQVGTPLQWFSNADLLLASASGICLIVLLRRRAGALWRL